MRRGGVLLLFVLLTLGFAPAPLPRVERRPRAQDQIIGTWTGDMTIQITKDRLTYHPGTSSRCEYVLRTDTTAQPWRYDITGVAGTSTAGRTYTGIFRIQGDVLTIRYASEGSNRPTSFDGGGFT
jgi:uncharacterized protein (TIGR03067 family)